MRRERDWSVVDAVPAGPSGHETVEHRIHNLTPPPPHPAYGYNHFLPVVDTYAYGPRHRGNLHVVEANVGVIRQLPSPSISFMDDSASVTGISRHNSELLLLPQLDIDREMSIPPQQRMMQMQNGSRIAPLQPMQDGGGGYTKADRPPVREKAILMNNLPVKAPALAGPEGRPMHRNPIDPALALKRLRVCTISDAVLGRPFGTAWTTDDLDLVFPLLVAVHESTRAAVAKEAGKLPVSIADKLPDPHDASKKKSGKLQFLFEVLQGSKPEDLKPEKRAQVLKACEIHLLKGMKLHQSEWEELRKLTAEIRRVESNSEIQKAASSLEVTTNRYAGILCTQRWSVHDKVRSEEEVEFNNRHIRGQDEDVEIRSQRRPGEASRGAGPIADLHQNPLEALTSTPNFFVDMITKLPGELWQGQDRGQPPSNPPTARPLPATPALQPPGTAPPLSSRRREEIRVMGHAIRDRPDQYVVM